MRLSTLVSLLYVVSLYDNCNPLICKDQKPSLGDLCLETNSNEPSKQGTLLLYYTDNVEQPRWGTICDNRIDNLELTSMCRQLGYKKHTDHKSIRIINSTIKPWFQIQECSPNVQHILRCELQEPAEECQSVIYLECGGGWNTIPTPDQNPIPGQLMLFHPNSSMKGHQVSFGLLLIYLQTTEDWTWGSINQNQTEPFTRTAADSACRQMGYTEADPSSISTIRNSNTQFTLTETQDNAWLISNNTRDCVVSSEPCFSCCFSSPSSQCSNIDACKIEDSVVLRCLFDRNKEQIPSDGSVSMCHIIDSQKPSLCSDTPQLYEKLTFGLTGLLVVMLLSIGIIAIVVVTYCVHKKRRQRPRRPAGEQQPLLNNNLDDGQQN